MVDCGIALLRPRERIISTARDLFRKHGIRGIGVDAIAEAAGTNKMTLYRHFRSKDELVAECLRDVGREADEIWKEFETRYPGDFLAQLYAWIRVGAECAGEDGRGCDMANAAVELAESNHSARHIIEEFKTQQRNRLVQLCRSAGILKPELLADTLWLLVEGASIGCQSMGAEGPGSRFIAIGEAVVSAFARETPLDTPARPQRHMAGKKSVQNMPRRVPPVRNMSKTGK